MEEFVYTAQDEQGTERLGEALAKTLPDGCVIAMVGTLGAGKTRLVRAVAEASGVPKETVASPTFVLVHEYQGDRPIYHFDTYRLLDEDEFMELGPDDYFDSNGLSFVEWADRVDSVLPDDRLTIEIEILAETARIFRLRPHGDFNSEIIGRIRKYLGLGMILTILILSSFLSGIACTTVAADTSIADQSVSAASDDSNISSNNWNGPMESKRTGGPNSDYSGNDNGFWGYTPDTSSAYRNSKMAAWCELFESSGISWRYLYREKNVQVLDHCRVFGEAHSGRQAEKITLNFTEKDAIILGHYLDYPIFNNETRPSLWIRSDHPGITLGALVVLPKTVRPDNGKALTLLVAGSTLQKAGEWEQLTFPDNIQLSLQRTIRAIRSEHHLKVSLEGAYIRQIILYLEGRHGKYTLWIDDLQVMGHLPASYDTLKFGENLATFEPINLLAFRIFVTNASIFPDLQDDIIEQTDPEPFAIGSQRLKKSKPLWEKSDLPTVPSYEEQQKKFYAKIGCPVPGTGHSEIVPFQREASPIATTVASEKIGQTKYLDESNTANSGIITQTPFTSPITVSSPEKKAQIVSGSGTMSNSVEAAQYSTLRGPDEKVGKIEFKERYLTFDDQYQYGVIAIEYQGEPLAFLKERGFNTIWLKKAPSLELLKEARQNNLWLIAPPPIGMETITMQSSTIPPNNDNKEAPSYFNRKPVDPIYDSVLVWNLGTNYQKSDLGGFQMNASLVRTLDGRKRPIICHADNGIHDFTIRDNADVLLIRRQPFLTSLDLCDYAQWLLQYRNMAIPDFPLWNEIQTQPDVQLLAQCRFFGAVEEMPSLISYEQMRQQIRLSLAAGCHGFLFSSNTPLNTMDHETQYRACALELLTRELLLAHPWFAGGGSEDIIDSNNDSFSAVFLRSKQTALLLPVSANTNDQYTMGQNALNNITFVSPVRDGYNAELLAPGNLQHITTKRQAGGVHVSLDEASMNSMIFMTQSDWYNQEVSDKAPLFGPLMSEQAIRIAKMRVDTYQKTITAIRQLAEANGMPMVGKRPLLSLPEQDTLFYQTQKVLLEAENLYKDGDYSGAWLQAERATREIRLSERQYWQTATGNEQCRPVLPVSVSFCMLPAYLENYRRILNQEVVLQAENRIIGGNMEDRNVWTEKGFWTCYQSPVDGVDSSVMNDMGSAHQGEYGLRWINQRKGNRAPAFMESSPTVIEICFPVKTGEMICIQGWLKIPDKLENTEDGLFIYEDHGGQALGLRFKDATDWRPFAFYRFASYDGQMKLRFSFSGYGEVWLDDLAAQVMK